MKVKLLLITSIIFWAVPSLRAQETNEFKPSGKPEVLIFTNFHSSFSDGQNVHKFDLTRAYFGYGYNFSPTLSGRVTLDVGNPGVGRLQMTAHLKYGYLQYQNERLTAKFGMIGTNGFDVQEKFWGYRYIYKSFQDEYGMGPSADLGLSAAYKFNTKLSADVILQNGEGSRSLDSDSTLKAGVGLTVRPVERVLLRGYYDRMKKGAATFRTTALMAGYSHKTFSIGAEYNYQHDNGLKPGHDYYGYSFYGTYFLKTTANIFSRYDYLNSKNDNSPLNAWNFSKDGRIFMAGFEYLPVKGIKIAPNFQLWTPRDHSKSSTSTFFLHLEIKI